jgi:hypothetical protein
VTKLIDEEKLRRSIEEHMENAEEFIRKQDRERALLEFDVAATKLDTAGKLNQLEQLWAHAAAGFTAAEAPLQAATSYLHLAELEVKAGRQNEARDSYLKAANSFFAVRDKNPDLWSAMVQALEHAIDLSLALEETSLAIELLYKTAIIQYRETGFALDAIYSLERAQQLLEQVPNHPLANDINEKLQELVDHQT